MPDLLLGGQRAGGEQDESKRPLSGHKLMRGEHTGSPSRARGALAGRVSLSAQATKRSLLEAVQLVEQ